MRAMIDDSEAILLIGYYSNIRNGLGGASVIGLAAVVHANGVHKKRIWSR